MDDQQFQNLLNGMPSMGKPDAPQSSDFNKTLQSLPDMSGGSTSPVPAAPTGTASGTPPAPPETQPTDYNNTSWGDVLSSAVKNLPSSAGNAIAGFGRAVMHPVQTGQMLGTLSAGALGEGEDWVRKQLGYEPRDFPGKAQGEALLNAVGKHYADTYGPLFNGDTSGLKKAIATDPFSVGMDVASVLPGVGEAVGAGKAADIASTLMDPVQAGLKTAGLAKNIGMYVGSKAAKDISGAASGVPTYLLDAAKAAGVAGDPTFRAFQSGQRDVSDLAKMASDALAEKKAGIRARFQNLKNIGTPVPTGGVVQSAKNLASGINPGNNPHLYDPQYLSDAKRVHDAVMYAATSPNPASRSMEAMDELRKGIGSIADRHPGTTLAGKIGQLKDSITAAMSSVHPDYAQALTDWGNMADTVKSSLGRAVQSPNSSDAFGVMLKAAKTPSGQDALSSLVNTKAGASIPAALAGAATRHYLPPRLRGLTEAGAAGALQYMLHPHPVASAAAAGAGALAASPRLTGSAMYNLGRLKPVIDAAGSVKNAALDPWRTYLATQLGKQENRPARKSGGAVDFEAAAERLIREASKAHKHNSKQTEVLLNEPDEVVMKALHIANRSI